MRVPLVLSFIDGIFPDIDHPANWGYPERSNDIRPRDMMWICFEDVGRPEAQTKIGKSCEDTCCEFSWP